MPLTDAEQLIVIRNSFDTKFEREMLSFYFFLSLFESEFFRFVERINFTSEFCWFFDILRINTV